jgi:hypothetical protein
MNPINQTLLRSILKIFGGYFVAKGLADDSTVEIVISGAVALAGIVWGVLHRKDSPQSVPITKLPLALAALGLALTAGAGCAFNRQYATTTSTNPTNGVVSVTLARSTTMAVLDAKSIIDKTRASAGKTSSVGASGVNEDATTANLATDANALTGLINALKTP